HGERADAFEHVERWGEEQRPERARLVLPGKDDRGSEQQASAIDRRLARGGAAFRCALDRNVSHGLGPLPLPRTRPAPSPAWGGGGGGQLRRSVSAFPHPVPPPQAGEGTMWCWRSQRKGRMRVELPVL